MLRAVVVLLWLLASASCAKKETRQLDLDLIRVTSDARLRTDTVGGGEHTDLATFVLVEAENTAKDGAYVTLGGELTDEAGKQVGELRAQSLWIPAGQLRTFALVDKQRKPRPDAKAAKIYVRGAQVPASPPRVDVDGVKVVDDGDKVLVQGTVKNAADRGGDIMVIATFYDANGKPMTRPFTMIWIAAKGEQAVQFAGPIGSKRGTIFIGDTAF